MSLPLRLVSHPLCPYVQRAVIVAAEKGIAIERELIDLAAKPSWFTALSPTGKVPLLQVDGHVLFESAAICEYLDETTPGALLPGDSLSRAKHRAWIEFASGTLADIAGLYSAADRSGFDAKSATLRSRFGQVEAALLGPWFGGPAFGLVDAAFGPVFRYLDDFEHLLGLSLADGQPKIAEWRARLAERPSVRNAVAPDYPARLERFLRTRPSWVGVAIEAAHPY